MPTRIASIAAAIIAIIVVVLAFQTSARLKDTQVQLEDTTASLNKTRSDLKSAEEKLATTTSTLETARKDLSDTQSKLDDKERELRSANEKLSSLESELRLANNELERLRTQLAQLPTTGGGAQDIATEIQRMRDEISTLTSDRERLQESLAAAQRSRADLEKRIERLTRGINPPGLEGRIIAVDGQWNFITFNLGQNDDIAQNSQVTVVRGDKPIAQVRVTTVENRRSFGDVIRLFGKELPTVGDTVITN